MMSKIFTINWNCWIEYRALSLKHRFWATFWKKVKINIFLDCKKSYLIFYLAWIPNQSKFLIPEISRSFAGILKKKNRHHWKLLVYSPCLSIRSFFFSLIIRLFEMSHLMVTNNSKQLPETKPHLDEICAVFRFYFLKTLASYIYFAYSFLFEMVGGPLFSFHRSIPLLFPLTKTMNNNKNHKKIKQTHDEVRVFLY